MSLREALASERGGATSVEAAIAVFTMFALLAFGLAAGRLTAAESAVTEAAHSAARLGSAVRDPAQAQDEATTQASQILAAQHLSCTQLTVVVEVPAAAVGTPAMATARVRCSVRWADLALPGVPGTREVSAEFTSTIDRYRERT